MLSFQTDGEAGGSKECSIKFRPKVNLTFSFRLKIERLGWGNKMVIHVLQYDSATELFKQEEKKRVFRNCLSYAKGLHRLILVKLEGPDVV